MAAALVLIGLLAAVAVLNCELPRSWAWPLAAVSALHGAWLARRELRRPTQALRVAADRFHLDGVELSQPRLHWRGLPACRSDRGAAAATGSAGPTPWTPPRGVNSGWLLRS